MEIPNWLHSLFSRRRRRPETVVGTRVARIPAFAPGSPVPLWHDCRHFWSLLVLWEYGASIYCDLDTLPRKWRPDFIQPSDDAHVVVEQFGTPSQYWMAASSKHPMMFHSLQRALYNTLGLLEIGGMDASLVAGPQAVMQGFMWFNKDVGVHVVKPVVEVVYVGRFNRSVRLEGIAEKSNKVILRQRIGKTKRRKCTMNMTHFSLLQRKWRASNRTCMAVGVRCERGSTKGISGWEDEFGYENGRRSLMIPDQFLTVDILLHGGPVPQSIRGDLLF